MYLARRCCQLLISLVLLQASTTFGAERRQVMEFTEFGAPSAATRTEVTALVDSFKTSWADQDTQAHLALFSEDAEWINAYARMFRGTEELSVFLEERLFPNWDARVSQEEMANARMVSIRYLDNRAAVVHMVTDGQRGPSTLSGESMRRTHMHMVTEKRGAAWKIVHVAIMDARE